MALYTCEKCGMSVGTMTCGKCGKQLVHDQPLGPENHQLFEWQAGEMAQLDDGGERRADVGRQEDRRLPEQRRRYLGCEPRIPWTVSGNRNGRRFNRHEAGVEIPGAPSGPVSGDQVVSRAWASPAAPRNA